MDGPSQQLKHEISDSVRHSIATRRPILHHLNADTSWLLQLPRPQQAVSRGGRHWFNILIDPWLSGSQSDVASWFSQQWHASTPAISSIAEVEDLARRIEGLSVRGHGLTKGHIKGHTIGEEEGSTLIDAITISHEFTDHCHQQTLLECHPDIPVFATTQAAKLIESWKHFRLVIDAPAFTGDGADWQALSLPPLPEWLAIGKMVNPADALYYHSAILIAFDCKETPRRKWSARYSGSHGDFGEAQPVRRTAEAVVYTPHGIHAPALEVIPKAEPPIRTLALLHGLHDVAISRQQLNMGAHNGLRAQRLLRARWWLGTHDEVKTAGGLVKWFLRRNVVSLQDALKQEQKALEEADEGIAGVRALDDVNFLNLGNGESVVLA